MSEDNNKDNKIEAKEKLRKSLLSNTTMVRPTKPNGSIGWMSPEMTILSIFSQAPSAVGGAFEGDHWPLLTDTMSKLTDDSKEKLQEAVMEAWPIIAKYMDRCTDRTANDITYLDCLEGCGWNDMNNVGKITYMSMFGMFVFARYWVVARQMLEMGTPSEKIVDEVANSAITMLRMYDQQIDPTSEAISDIRKAIDKAVKLDMSISMIMSIVEKCVANSALESAR
jgi:uncharacterized membrane protein